MLPTHTSSCSSGRAVAWGRQPMRTSIRLVQVLVLCIASLGAASAFATLSAHFQRGTKLVELSVPGRHSEVCIIPKHFNDATYSGDDLRAEAQLCGIDENANAVVCPKTNSTNPGLDVYS